jgi:transcriptional repressor NrdR
MSTTFLCPECSHDRTKVTNTRGSPLGSGVRRKRKCLGCDHVFTTEEMAVTDSPQFYASHALKRAGCA